MMMIRLIASLLFLATMAGSGFSQASVWSIQKDVAFLSSDLTQGRMTGTNGERLSARYIAERYAQIGLTPKGEEGYYQTFTFKAPANPHDTKGEGEEKTCTNVVGYIDNGAPTTVIIGAHYDHLGLGGSGSGSLSTDVDEIHNGADDNASGVAALLYIAEQLNKGKDKSNNYLFIAFSGEELGLFGSKHYADDPTIDLATANYMINMDMVGRLDSVLVINGVGTSPSWSSSLDRIKTEGFSITTTESGVGPSDHTSFYRKDIPSIHFFTGQHKDYHKPTDDANLVNHEGIQQVGDYILALIHQTNDLGKLDFIKTKDTDSRKAASFKVTLGVMPDYTFQGDGMRIDGVLDDRPAQKAGLEDGDIILQIGETSIGNIYDYMGALAKYSKGQKAMVKVKRKDQVMEKEVEF